MNDLFAIAENSGIEVIYRNAPLCRSMSMPGYVCMDYDLLWGGAEERVRLAHELGHCQLGAFYNRWAAQDIRQKHEHRADKWAIERTVPKEELEKAISSGYTDIWALAEHFGVTEDFMKKAICWYKYGTLATELYF